MLIIVPTHQPAERFQELLVVVVVAAVSFSYSAAVNERFMTRGFVATHPAYQRGSKMLVPFVR